MAIAYVFPGQGSQTPGMGKSLAENFSVAREVFEEVDEALDFSLSRLCFVIAGYTEAVGRAMER